MLVLRYRLVSLVLLGLVAMLSGCPEPEDAVGNVVRRRASPTPLGGSVGQATPTPIPNPAGNVTGNVPTPTPTGTAVTPTPSPTRAPLHTPVPAETATPAPEPSPTEFTPIGEDILPP